MRTGAVTAIGAKHLARKNSRILGHIGARGTAYWNVRLLDHLFDFDVIRVHSRRPESRNTFAEQLAQDLGKPVVATDDWQSCVVDADIVVEASRLETPEPLLKEVLDFVRFLNVRSKSGGSEMLMASETALGKDWLLPEEDEAWKEL